MAQFNVAEAKARFSELQCFPAGTPIRTPEGQRPIESLQTGDIVLAASGRGSTLTSRINHVGHRHFDGKLVRVVTRGGHTFLATTNHIVFARLGVNPGLNYVYLMYRKEIRAFALELPPTQEATE